MGSVGSLGSTGSLTRRRFLGQLGAVGGIVARHERDDVVGRDGRPGGRAARAHRPSARGEGPASSAPVVSGLVVGYELEQTRLRLPDPRGARPRRRAWHWTVRRGSRSTPRSTASVRSAAFDEGLHVNVGPWRIPYTHTGVLNYCKELGVSAADVRQRVRRLVFLLRRRTPPAALSNTRVRLREVKADMIGHTNELLVKAIDQRQLDLPLDGRRPRSGSSRLSRVGQGYLDASDRRYKAFANRGPGDPYALGGPAAGRLRQSAAIGSGDATAPRRRRCFIRSAGMDQISQGLSARRSAATRITFNAEVQSVHQGESDVKVVYLDTKSGRKTESPRTTSSSACRCRCWPAWTSTSRPEMMEAVRATTYSNSAKMGLAMKRRFWEEDDQIFGGHLYSNLPLGEFSYPSQRSFLTQGRAAGSVRERRGRRPARPAGQGARRARADAREQGPSADPAGVRERTRSGGGG